MSGGTEERVRRLEVERAKRSNVACYLLGVCVGGIYGALLTEHVVIPRRRAAADRRAELVDAGMHARFAERCVEQLHAELHKTREELGLDAPLPAPDDEDLALVPLQDNEQDNRPGGQP